MLQKAATYQVRMRSISFLATGRRILDSFARGIHTHGGMHLLAAITAGREGLSLGMHSAAPEFVTATIAQIGVGKRFWTSLHA